MAYIFSLDRHAPFVVRLLNMLLEPMQINTLLELEKIKNTLLELKRIKNRSLKLKRINTLLELDQINTLLELDQIDTLLKLKQINTLPELKQINTSLKLKYRDIIVSLACTCKEILKICTTECEDRLRTLLESDPNNINLVLYKTHIRKWYLFNNSRTPLHLTVSSLLRRPVEKITRVALPPRKFKFDNLTISYPEREILCLYDINIEELSSQTLDHGIHTLILCDSPITFSFHYIFRTFPSLIKLKLIRMTLYGAYFATLLSSSLITLSIIECNMRDCDIHCWLTCFSKLQKLKWENNICNIDTAIHLPSSINSVSITHTKSEPLFINTMNCGRGDVSIK
jgi:hypothetical protein